MDGERFQVIPRKKIQIIVPILIGIIYFSFYLFLPIMNNYQIDIFFFSLIGIPFFFNFIQYLVWRRNWYKLGCLISFNQEEINILNLFKPPKLTGSYRGYQFNLFTYSEVKGWSIIPFTKIEMDFSFEVDADFSLRKKGFLQQNTEQTGIDEFDRKFYLDTKTEWIKKRLFQNSEIKDGVMDILKQADSMHLNLIGNRISHLENTRIKDTDYLLAVMDYLIKMACVFRQNSL